MLSNTVNAKPKQIHLDGQARAGIPTIVFTDTSNVLSLVKLRKGSSVPVISQHNAVPPSDSIKDAWTLSPPPTITRQGVTVMRGTHTDDAVYAKVSIDELREVTYRLKRA
jgi:hypothetical protein